MDQEIFQFKVPSGQPKMRLDKFLIQNIENISRSRIQKLIEDKKITLNGMPTKASHSINTNELISVTLPPPQPSEIIPEDIPLNIVFEDNNLLVVNKDAGMVVHPAYGNMKGTLVNALHFHCKELSGIGGIKRPGIVHRLDKDTSGLLVIAKNDITHQHLSDQFSKREVKREYNSIVWGYLPQNEGIVESHIARSVNDRTKMVNAKSGKHAITTYNVIRQYKLACFISLQLKTGRTHQIRVHMASIGHPVIGDKTYGGRTKQTISFNQSDKILAHKLLDIMPRQALHAKSLGFKHPVTNKFLHFNSELPSDIINVLHYLELTQDYS